MECPMTEDRTSTEFQIVFTANGEAEASGVRTALEAAGIPVQVRVESATKLFPVTVDGLGAVRILVPADRVEEARMIIDTPAEPAASDDGADF
jgi:hypothetical protein